MAMPTVAPPASWQREPAARTVEGVAIHGGCSRPAQRLHPRPTHCLFRAPPPATAAFPRHSMPPGPTHDGSTEALRLSEQRAQLAVDVARLGTWTWTRKGHGASRIELDARCREICGLHASGAVAREELFARIHPADRHRVEQALALALDPDGFGQFAEDIRFLHADGSVRWSVSRGRTRFSGEGDACVAELFGSVVDITAQVSFNDRYRALFDSIDRGFCVIEMLFDGDGTAAGLPLPGNQPALRRPDRPGRCDRQARARTGAGARAALVRHLWPRRATPASRCASRAGRGARPLVRRLRLPRRRSARAPGRVLFADITERSRTEQALRERPAQGRIPGHARARAAQPAGADPQRRCDVLRLARPRTPRCACSGDHGAPGRPADRAWSTT